jgi:hypothetical protein
MMIGCIRAVICHEFADERKIRTGLLVAHFDPCCRLFTGQKFVPNIQISSKSRMIQHQIDILFQHVTIPPKGITDQGADKGIAVVTAATT